MDLAMELDPSLIVFGEDVAFGGVFRYIPQSALLRLPSSIDSSLCVGVHWV